MDNELIIVNLTAINTQRLMKFYLNILTVSCAVFLFSTINAQTQNEKFIGEFIKQINLQPGPALGFSARNIYHVYDISIPSTAVVKEYPTSYSIDKVEVTLAVSNGAYDITKEKITYSLTVFKEFKGSYTMARKDLGSIITYWTYKEATKEFSAILKGLKNLETTEFSTLYGPDDDFPMEWKAEQ